MKFDPFGDFETAGYLQKCSTAKGHLNDYLQPFVVDIAHRDEWPGMIGGLKGWDGLDKERITYESLDNPEVQKIYATYRAQSLAVPSSEK